MDKLEIKVIKMKDDKPKTLYKAYLKSDKRTSTSVISAHSDSEALAQACAELKVTADRITLVRSMMLTCPKCSYSWFFKGFRKLYATCPQCMKSVLIADSNPVK